MGRAKKPTSEQRRAKPSFGQVEYWNDAFETGEFTKPFDWLATWEDLRSDIEAALPDKAGKILIPGCGNAPFQLDMYGAGYRNLVCADNSEVVIGKMEEATKESHPGIQWDLMDASDMSYADGSFDAVIDKSLMDALLCSEDPARRTRLYFDEVFRVLAPGGLLVLVSCHQERSLRANLRGRDCLICDVHEVTLGDGLSDDGERPEAAEPSAQRGEERHGGPSRRSPGELGRSDAGERPAAAEPPAQGGGPPRAAQRGGSSAAQGRPPEAPKGPVVTLCACLKGRGGAAGAAEAAESAAAAAAPPSSRKKTRDERRKAAKMQRRMVQAHMQDADLA